MEIVDRILSGTIAAILGAFSAFLFNRLNWQESTKKESIISLESEIINTIDSLAECSLTYWSSDQNDLKNSKLLEAKIKMLFNMVSPSFRQLAFVHGKFSAGDHQKISSEIESLFEYTTDGDFESKNRKSSPKKCLKISNSCNKIKINIRRVIHSQQKNTN
ncbi:hypothetical protein [Shewanella sp. cp20]|uniref:hypothetical protein n=1 Tax=Shewanella sp. cp20 TaxID=1521167 RepID=UPI00059FC829|nr:hypothetical protein [Shewanella sp. cp20]